MRRSTFGRHHPELRLASGVGVKCQLSAIGRGMELPHAAHVEETRDVRVGIAGKSNISRGWTRHVLRTRSGHLLGGNSARRRK
jgi:hypothetical protein